MYEFFKPQAIKIFLEQNHSNLTIDDQLTTTYLPSSIHWRISLIEYNFF